MSIRRSVLLVVLTALMTFAVLFPVSNRLRQNHPEGFGTAWATADGGSVE
jgi:uncharacterized protein YybS (DUF2232 family)